MKRKISLIVEHDFFLENGSQLGVFWSRRGLQVNHGTVRKSAIFSQPGNQERLNEAILLMAINEALLSRQNFVPFK